MATKTKVAANSVFSVLGDTLESARGNAYAAVEKIRFPGMFYRKDIAEKALRADPSANPNPPPIQS